MDTENTRDQFSARVLYGSAACALTIVGIGMGTPYAAIDVMALSYIGLTSFAIILLLALLRATPLGREAMYLHSSAGEVGDLPFASNACGIRNAAVDVLKKMSAAMRGRQMAPPSTGATQVIPALHIKIQDWQSGISFAEAQLEKLTTECIESEREIERLEQQRARAESGAIAALQAGEQVLVEQLAKQIAEAERRAKELRVGVAGMHDMEEALCDGLVRAHKQLKQQLQALKVARKAGCIEQGSSAGWRKAPQGE